MYKFGILKNDVPNDEQLWIQACNDYHEVVDYEIIDILQYNWLEKIDFRDYDFLLAIPPCLSSLNKLIYDERIKLIVEEMGISVYPSPLEIYLYENKRFLSDWLSVNSLPHPKTYVYLSEKQFGSALKSFKFPIVAKTNIGSSGKGVVILKDPKELEQYFKKSFSTSGVPKIVGPKRKLNVAMNLLKGITSYKMILEKLRKYWLELAEKQVGMVILQEYIEHDYEWRVVCIGDSYFAHKKIKIGEKASGSLKKEYGDVPVELLNFCREIVEQFNLKSMAFDIFESAQGYLINEMQCIFGQSDPYQMLIGNKPGRYLFSNSHWKFQEGSFNQNESFNLRVAHILDILKTASVKH